MNPNTKWMLQKALDEKCLTLHSKSAASYAGQLVAEGLLHRSDVYPIWYITPLGRRELENDNDD